MLQRLQRSVVPLASTSMRGYSSRTTTAAVSRQRKPKSQAHGARAAPVKARGATWLDVSTASIEARGDGTKTVSLDVDALPAPIVATLQSTSDMFHRALRPDPSETSFYDRLLGATVHCAPRPNSLAAADHPEALTCRLETPNAATTLPPAAEASQLQKHSPQPAASTLRDEPGQGYIDESVWEVQRAATAHAAAHRIDIVEAARGTAGAHPTADIDPTDLVTVTMLIPEAGGISASPLTPTGAVRRNIVLVMGAEDLPSFRASTEVTDFISAFYFGRLHQ